MKKGFKLIIGITLIMSIFVFGYTYYSLYMNKELSGEKIADGIYLYKLDIGNENHGVKIHDDSIYYWTEAGDKFSFYKMDIYRNKETKIGEFNSNDSYCYFEDDFIECSNDNNKTLYNYKFKKLYEGDIKTVIPYKKDFIKYENNTVYYKDKEYKKVKTDLTGYNFYRYEAFENNIYLFFAGLGENESCLLNVMDNKCEDYKYSNVKDYPKGLYFIDKEKIRVLNVETNELKEYDNPLQDEYLTASALDDNKLYYFVDDYLRIYNLETGKISLLDYRLNAYIDDMYINDNLLYLVLTDKVYVFNLDEITTQEYTKEELEAKLEEMLMSRIEKIKTDYNVEIMIRKDADLKFDVFNEKMEGEREYDAIDDSLDATEEVFALFGKDFFNEFIHGEYKGLRIYLTNNITSNEFSKSGEAFRYYDNYAIIANSYDYKRTLCHELMHSLEDAVDAKNKPMLKKWNSYNPKGFKYKINYNEYDTPYKYTLSYDKGDVYFIDNYSQTNELEDRARVFENICMNTTNEIMENEHLLNKAKYLEEEILKYYPMLKDTTLFDSIN